MQHGVYPVLSKQLVKAIAIPDIALRECRRYTTDFPHALQRDHTAVTQVVEHHHLPPGLNQCDTCMTADVTHTSCHQYRTGHSRIPLCC